MTKKKPITQHTRDFQENAVRLSKLPGKSIASVAIELGIPAWKLRTWVKESKQKLERSSEVTELIRILRPRACCAGRLHHLLTAVIRTQEKLQSSERT